MTTENLHFDVSSGLKSVLGSELITDDEVAIFELVKNSFDANATYVDLYFEDNKIIVLDNGDGMSLNDIKSRWLFVAYSSKRDSLKSDDFRHEVASRGHYAGSKGIGRFSSDRLGQKVILQSKSKTEKSRIIHRVEVDWSLFDKNYKNLFENINVEYSELQGKFDLPNTLKQPSHGVAITIENLRRVWDRTSLLRLRSSLAKLINPFGSTADNFRITIHAPNEIEEDREVVARAKAKEEETPPNKIVNGEVGNFIFSTLQEKTTFIDVHIDETGNYLISSLTDRGEVIYRIREPNKYEKLRNSGFKCQLFFLNTSAKLTFARRVGVPSVQFGSVFLFRNGFRVFPIGNEGNDWYGMDRRKQQGYNRFLGSREVIGRIDVTGDEGDFSEASSRNAGLIETLAVNQLRECFMEHCLKRLERYVVNVTFIDREDRNSEDISRLLTDPGRARVSSAIAKLVDNDQVELIDYSKRLVTIISERSSQFEMSLASLRAIAEKTSDKDLLNKLDDAETRFDELRRSEEAAIKQANEERQAKEEALLKVIEVEKSREQVKTQLDEERKRNLFLTSIASLDTETILNLHHQITIYSVDIQQQIQNFLVSISNKEEIPAADVVNVLESITLLNLKVMGISKFATKANFRLESEQIEADLAHYIEQYIYDVASKFLLDPITLDVETDGKGFIQKFKPIDVSIVLDNLINNAKKASATRIEFHISHPSKDVIYIQVSDNGKGFDKKITDLSRIFEKGFTTTRGSGLGLFHVQQVLGEMNGTIEAQRREDGTGTNFLIRISKTK